MPLRGGWLPPDRRADPLAPSFGKGGWGGFSEDAAARELDAPTAQAMPLRGSRLRLRRPDAGFRARATGRRRVAGPSAGTSRRPGRAALVRTVACSGAAVRPLDGTSLCRARSRQPPVASTCQPHQGWCVLLGDLSAAQTGLGIPRCRRLVGDWCCSNGLGVRYWCGLVEQIRELSGAAGIRSADPLARHHRGQVATPYPQLV